MDRSCCPCHTGAESENENQGCTTKGHLNGACTAIHDRYAAGRSALSRRYCRFWLDNDCDRGNRKIAPAMSGE